MSIGPVRALLPRTASPAQRDWRTIWIVTLLLLLTGIVSPPLYDQGAPVGLAEAVQTQSDATACSAVGNNWTSCDEATASDDLYAEAEDGWAERGSITPLVAFQDTQQSVSSTSLQDANAETGALASGVPYLVIYSGNHGGSDQFAVSELVLEFGATVIGRGVAEGRGTDNHWDSGQTAGFYVVTGDGASTLRFRFRCVTIGDTCYAGSMAIIALPLNLLTEGKEYWYEVRNGDGWNVTNAPTFTWVDLLTATFSLPEDGDYLVLMSGEGATSPDQGDEGVRMRFLANGTILGSEYVQELEDSRDSYNFMKSQMETLSAGSQTFEVEARSRGVAFADFRRGRIVVLRAAAFDQILQTTDTSGDTTTNASFVDFAGLTTTFTPHLPEWVVILANAVLGSHSQSAMAEIRDATTGVSFRVNSGEVENDVGFDSDRDQQPTLMAHAAQVAATNTWKVRYRAIPGSTAAFGRNAPNTEGIRSDLIIWGLALPGPGRNDTAWFNFGYGLDPEDMVGRVEVGIEWHRVTPEPILDVTVSWDGGLSWASNQTATNKSTDDDTLEWLDFTAATTWDPAKLLDANLRVRAGTNASGSRIDRITVRVTYNDAPRGSNLRLLDAGGQSLAGELLDANTTYRFLFNVTDDDGWADIGQDGGVTLRLWYDGAVTPELTFAQQTNGSDYRIEVRYEDLTDAGNATLDEWSVTEGSASYEALDSSLSDIYNGPTLIGYEFALVLKLGLQVKPTPDPTDSAPGGYNDPDSWNVELEAFDGGITSVLRTVPTGEHLEFGVFARPGPAFSPVLIVDRSTAERGDIVTATLFYNNSGSEPFPFAWANWSLNGHYELVDLTPPVLFAPSANGFDVTLPNVTPGDHSLTARLRVVRGMSDNLLMDLQVGWEATNVSGGSSGTTMGAAVILLAPALSLSLSTPETRIETGSVFGVNLVIRNRGQAAASGWLNMTAPLGLQYVNHTGPLVITQSPGLITWDVSVLPAGTTLSFQILFEGPENPGVETLQLSLAYTDLRGSPPETVLSNQVLLEFLGSPGLLGGGLPWWLLMVLAAVGATTAFLLARRSRSGPEIEEVFVVHQNGVLIAHRSKTLTPDKDEDVLAAMLSTVQGFIQDAFREHEDNPVRSLQFEKFNILVEQGTHHYVAVVFRGPDNGSLQARLHDLSERIEGELGETLAGWTGASSDVRPVKALLPMLWGRRKAREKRGRPRPAAVPEEPHEIPPVQPEEGAIPGITKSGVRKARKPELRAWCLQLGLSDSGSVKELRERLLHHREAPEEELVPWPEREPGFEETPPDDAEEEPGTGEPGDETKSVEAENESIAETPEIEPEDLPADAPEATPEESPKVEVRTPSIVPGDLPGPGEDGSKDKKAKKQKKGKRRKREKKIKSKASKEEPASETPAEEKREKRSEEAPEGADEP